MFIWEARGAVHVADVGTLLVGLEDALLLDALRVARLAEAAARAESCVALLGDAVV